MASLQVEQHKPYDYEVEKQYGKHHAVLAMTLVLIYKVLSLMCPHTYVHGWLARQDTCKQKWAWKMPCRASISTNQAFLQPV